MRRRRELPSERMRTGRRTRLPAHRGQALLEFALIFLVIYLLIVAIVEFGRLFSGQQTLQSAVDQAARELSPRPADSDGHVRHGAYRSSSDQRRLRSELSRHQHQRNAERVSRSSISSPRRELRCRR